MADQVAQFEQFRKQDQPLAGRINPITNVEGGISELSRSREMGLQNLFAQLPQQVEQQDVFSGPGFQPDQEFSPSAMVNREDLPPITQTFGQRSKYDVFSGGVNYGVDYGVKEGTPVGLPAGQWEVVEAFGEASGRGRIGDNTNRGYGNSILVKNQKTGETLRLSHLQRVGVRPGQVIPGGTVIATSGATGNVTGSHLDVEYRDKSGRLGDVLRTPYANQLVGKGGGDSLGKGGGFIDTIKSGASKALQVAKDISPEYKLVKSPSEGGWKAMSPEEQKQIVEQSMIFGTTSPIGGTRQRFIPKQLMRKDDIGVADDVLRQIGADRVFKRYNKDYIKNILKATTNATEEQLGKLSEGQLRNELIKLTNLAEDFYGTKDLARSRIGRTIRDLAKSRLRR